MARMAFIQLNHYELHGPQAISALLKDRGHQVILVVPGLDRRPFETIAAFQPDLIGIGHTTVEREEALLWAAALKKKTGAKVVFGGIDPTFHPAMVMNPAVDAVVMGEAELTVAEIMDRIQDHQDFSDVAGIAHAKDGQLVQNPMRPLIPDLDALPFPDKDLYLARYRYFRNFPIKLFMASRGCPHHCTYCCNRGLRALYPDPEHYVRFKSPEYLIKEIKTSLQKYPARTLGFNDDLFVHRASWLAEFLPRYRREIGVPFFCTARIDAMNDEKARLLKDGGCFSIWYGVETADPNTRELILGRRITNDKIREGAAILRRHGIGARTFNMLNIPGETLDHGIATLKLNHELKTDQVLASLFQPFPGTELARQLEEQGKISAPEKLGTRRDMSFFAFSPFRQEDTPQQENLQKLFIFGNHFPSLVPIIKKLCGLPANPLFDLLFLASFAFDYATSHRLHLWEVAYYSIRHVFTTYSRKNRLTGLGPGMFLDRE